MSEEYYECMPAVGPCYTNGRDFHCVATRLVGFVFVRELKMKGRKPVRKLNVCQVI